MTKRHSEDASNRGTTPNREATPVAPPNGPLATLTRRRDSQLAALNLMEDAVQARQLAEKANRELRSEIAERRLAEALLQHQKEALEMLAGPGTIVEVLDLLARAVESESSEGMRAAIHLLNSTGTHFSTAVAPSLPPAYLEATEGLEIATLSGPWCQAVLSGEPVSVPDIENDPRFRRFAEFAIRLGILAGWSAPIRSADGKVIAILALYYPQPQEPGERDRRVMTFITRTVALAIECKQAEQALRESERDLSDFFENASIGLHWAGPDGIVLRVNQAELDMLGYGKTEYVGHHIAEFHADKQIIADILTRLTHGEILREYPARLRCKDGSLRDVVINSSGLFENGRFIHTRCFTTDVTERKRAEQALAESESFNRSAFESSPDCVKVLDAEGRLLRMNASGLRLMDIDDFAPWLGRPWCDLWPAEKRHVARAAVEIARGGEIGRFQGYCLTARGTPKWWDVSVSSICDADGKAIRFVSVSRDLTVQKQTEEATAHLAAIVTSSKDAIVSKDLNGVIASWNEGAEHLFGYSAEEAVGKPVTLLIPTDHLDEEPQILERIRRGEVIANYESVRRRKDGSLVDVSLTVSPIRDSTGGIVGASKVARDITERKQAEKNLRESEERFRMLADNMSQLAWTCDTLGNVTWYNQRWLDFTGLSFEEMRGWNWSKVQHPDHLARVVERVKRSAETGEAWDDTFPLRGKNGEYRWFLSRAVPIRDPEGKVVRWFGTNTDVTEQREMSEELQRNAVDMAEADRRKNEFLATLAHELRNPLAPLRNAVQALRMSPGKKEAVAMASGMMERQIGQMVQLVDDLIDVSRITRNKIELRKTRIELKSVVEHAVEAAQSLVEYMGHELTVTLPTDPIHLNADATRLTQVIGNLFSNACKFTESGGRISLTAEREGHWAVVRVRDNGIGIAPDQIPHIFEMFMQVDTSLERSVGGLGIGLSLVKSLIELHDGTVGVQSLGIGQGSEFIVRLPIPDEAAGSPFPEAADAEPTSSAAWRILVVDDNADSAESLAMLLTLSGSETRTAADGVEAVEAAESFRPDVILLDIGLPKLNGYEACRRIREQPWSKNMTLIALTGWGQEEDRRKSAEAGFNGHLVKPVEINILMKLLAESRT